MIPPGIYRRGRGCEWRGEAVRLCSAWWDAQQTVSGEVLEELLRGMSSQIAEQEDAKLCADIRTRLVIMSCCCLGEEIRNSCDCDEILLN